MIVFASYKYERNLLIKPNMIDIMEILVYSNRCFWDIYVCMCIYISYSKMFKIQINERNVQSLVKYTRFIQRHDDNNNVKNRLVKDIYINLLSFTVYSTAKGVLT